MSAERFEEIIRGVEGLVGVPLPLSDPDAEDTLAVTLHLDDVPVTLAWSPRHCSDQVFVTCRFGSIPESLEARAMRKLLEANFSMSREFPAVLSLDPSTGEVIFEFNAPIDAVTAESALAGMQEAARHARDWRRTHFLTEGEPVRLLSAMDEFA